MTGAVVYERINNDNYSVIYEQKKYLYGKLREIFEDVREKKFSLKHKLLNDKVKMNAIREKVKTERVNSVLSMTNQRLKETIICTITTTTTTEFSTVESPPKSILKTKQPTLPTKSSRAISAPANGHRIPRKKPANNSIPSIDIPPFEEINHSYEQLAKSNGHSYTQICSSSQYSIKNADQSSRQSVLNTIMSHLHLHTPSTLSKWNLYHQFDQKLSASFSPSVHRNYERIIL